MDSIETMSSRSQESPRRSCGFLWQACLILGPVLVLALVGAALLRQDKRLVEQEAREQAEDLADELATVLWSDLTDPPRFHSAWVSFATSALGELVRPAPIPAPPVPEPLPVDALNPGQVALWRAVLEPAEPVDPDPSRSALEAFLTTEPPERFVAMGWFQRGLQLAGDGHHDPAFRAFERLLREHPEARGETGLPLRSLALIKLLEGAMTGTGSTPESLSRWFDLACSNAVVQPTLLTPLLLDTAMAAAGNGETNVVRGWLDTWARQEEARRFYALVRGATGPGVEKGAPGLPDGTRISWLKLEHETLDAASPSATTDRPRKPSSRRGAESGPIVPVTDLVSNIHAAERVRMLVGTDRPARVMFRPASSEWLVSNRPGPDNTREFLCRPLAELVAEIHLARRGPSDLESNWRLSFAQPGSVIWHEDAPAFPARLAQILKRMPAYMDVSLSLAGRTIIAPESLPNLVETSVGKGGGTMWRPSPELRIAPPIILAGAIRPGAGSELLRLQVHLASPQLLYARQQARVLWFGLLIVGSGLAALIGLGGGWRAFHQQRRLAELQTNFVSSVSHELRAPIASVRLMAEGLERGSVPDPGKQRDYHRFIVQECRRLTGMVENVLNYARIEQGRKEYEFEPTDLRRLVADTVKLMEPAAAEGGVKLVPHEPVTREVQPVVDGPALQQALVNLIDNAIKHSPTGGTVGVSLDHQPTRIQLSVRDEGPGIPPEDQERVFERFYRRGSELRRETTGVGIGLSIVRHIVHAHGGQVWVESRPGQGCRFVMELPGSGEPET